VNWKKNGEGEYNSTDKQNGRYKNMGVEMGGNRVDVQKFIRKFRRTSAERCTGP